MKLSNQLLKFQIMVTALELLAEIESILVYSNYPLNSDPSARIADKGSF